VSSWTSAKEQLIGMIFDGMILDVLLLFFALNVQLRCLNFALFVYYRAAVFR